jgi:hypothetical protein
MSTPPISYYVSLITSEYQNSAKLIAFLTAALQKLDDVSTCADGLVDDFDLDNAVGVQLDTLGVIIGQSRVLTVALTCSSTTSCRAFRCPPLHT